MQSRMIARFIGLKDVFVFHKTPRDRFPLLLAGLSAESVRDSFEDECGKRVRAGSARSSSFFFFSATVDICTE